MSTQSLRAALARTPPPIRGSSNSGDLFATAPEPKRGKARHRCTRMASPTTKTRSGDSASSVGPGWNRGYEYPLARFVTITAR